MSDQPIITPVVFDIIPAGSAGSAFTNEEPIGGYTPRRRPQLHISGLDTLWGCGERFYRIYIVKERSDASVAMIVGLAVDKAVNDNLEYKMDTGELLEVEQVRAIAADTFEIEWSLKTIVYRHHEWIRGEAIVKAEAKEKAIRLAVLHHEKLAPLIWPTHVQRSWAIEIPGMPFDLVGTIDIQEGRKAIRDTKSSEKSPNGNIADVSDQLTSYDLAILTIDGFQVEKVKLDYLINNKVAKAMTLESTRNADDHRVFMNRVENAAEVIQKGAFTPARPADWICSRDFCGFADSCRYFKKPKSIVIQTGE